MSIRGVFGVVMVTGLLLITVGVILAADSDIVISEVMIDADYEIGNRGEWFEIYNKGTSAENIADWVIEDDGSTDTITDTMCPSGDCTISAGECWLVARTQPYLQIEFNGYTNPLSPTVQTTKTIFIDSMIGNGLNNAADILILQNSSGTAVDCVSWGSSTFCSPLTYVLGGGGADQTNDGSNGQSITNIQSTWYDHLSNASPYDCINTADGGPTAVRLLKIAVTRRVPVLLGMSMVLLALVGLVITRRRA